MKNRLRYLLQGYFKGEATSEEIEELMFLLDNNTNKDEVLMIMDEVWNNFDYSKSQFSIKKSDAIIEKILNDGVKHRFTQKTKLLRIYSAAAVLLVAVLSSVVLYQGVFKSDVQNVIVKSNEFTRDISPGNNKAELILSDGRKVNLDSASNGNLIKQGNTILTKTDGLIAYNAAGQSNEVIYNTISIPRGGQYQLLLSDGTKVWLNAESSLHYPTTFDGNDRTVELTGEGYFEVAEDSKKFFKVKILNRAEIVVYGTHFNINSYLDETSIKTTLLEGSVSLLNYKSNESYLLVPGQQARLSLDGNVKIVSDENVGEVIAWKDEKFNFGESSEVQEVMRQISRWYDVEIVYNNHVLNRHIGGSISRNVNISQVLKMLEMTGEVKFIIEDKKIMVNSPGE